MTTFKRNNYPAEADSRMESLLIALITVLLLIVVALFDRQYNSPQALAVTPTPTPTSMPTPDPNTPPSGLVLTRANYPWFVSNAGAGFMQIVTIPDTVGMDKLDQYGYLVVNKDGEAALTGKHHTYAVAQLYSDDARTNVGCFEAWRFDGRDPSVTGYGEAFCISDNDMLWLFDHGAYALSYNGY